MYRIMPNNGLVVPGPDGRPLPADGLLATDGQITRFWRRRRDDGDVTIVPVTDAEAAIADMAADSPKTKKG